MSEFGNWGLPLGAVKDRHIDYVQKRVWIPANMFVQGQVSGASSVLTTDPAGSTGTVVALPTGIVAIKFTATTENTDILWRVPYDFDNRHSMRFRLYWTSDYGVANGTVTFRLLQTALATNALIAVGATAMTSAWAASTKTAATADIPYWTGYAVMGLISTGANAYQVFADNTEFLALRINVNAVAGLTLATHFAYVYGMEIAYTPKLTFGDGSRREARWTESNLGLGAADPTVQSQ